jgi:hypothetical protein
LTFKVLLGQDRVKKEPPSKSELDDLRSIVERSLADSKAPGLSADARFVMAYDAARTLSLMVVRAAGYRPGFQGGHHYNTFLALEAADPSFKAISTYFDGCRIKRNQSEYDFAGGVSEAEAKGLLAAAEQFALDAEAWIKARHPSLA